LKRVFFFSRNRLVQFLFDNFFQLPNIFTSHAHRKNTRHFELRAQLFQIDFRSVLFGHIPHIQCQHHRKTQLDYLGREIKVPFEIVGIDHHNDEIRKRRVFLLSKQNILNDFFVKRTRDQAVSPRKIQYCYFFTAGKGHLPDTFFHGHTRIIGRTMAEPCQRVEDRSLPGIGISDKRNLPFLIGLHAPLDGDAVSCVRSKNLRRSFPCLFRQECTSHPAFV